MTEYQYCQIVEGGQVEVEYLYHGQVRIRLNFVCLRNLLLSWVKYCCTVTYRTGKGLGGTSKNLDLFITLIFPVLYVFQILYDINENNTIHPHHFFRILSKKWQIKFHLIWSYATMFNLTV